MNVFLSLTRFQIYLPIHQLRFAPVRSSDSNAFMAKKSCSSWEKISTKWELTDQQNSWALLQVIEVVALNKMHPILTWVASVQYFGQSDLESPSSNSEPLAKAMQKRKVEMAFFSDMSTRVPPHVLLDFSLEQQYYTIADWSLCVKRSSSYLRFTIHILCLLPLCNQRHFWCLSSVFAHFSVHWENHYLWVKGITFVLIDIINLLFRIM